MSHRRKRYITSHKYRNRGHISQGAAGVIILIAVLMIWYWKLIVTFGAIGLLGWYAERRLNQRRLLKSGIEEIDRMEGREFEIYLGALFNAHGYKTQVTKATGDYGADLVLSKGSSRIVIQAKRYKGKVGVEAIQQVKSSMPKYGANNAWVVTNSEYTQKAYQLANLNGVRLINRHELIKLINKVNIHPQQDLSIEEK